MTKQPMHRHTFGVRGSITHTFSGKVVEAKPTIPIPPGPEPPVTPKIIATINGSGGQLLRYEIDPEMGDFIYDENLKSVKVDDIEISEQLYNHGGYYLFDSVGEHTISYEFDDVSDGTKHFWDVDIETIILPENITSFSPAFFNEYSVNYLTSMTILATTPPILGEATLHGSYPIFVPDASVDAYKTAWPQYASRIKPLSQKFFVKLTMQDYLGHDPVGESREIELEGNGTLTYEQLHNLIPEVDAETGMQHDAVTDIITGNLCTGIGYIYSGQYEGDPQLSTFKYLQNVVVSDSVQSIDNSAFDAYNYFEYTNLSQESIDAITAINPNIFSQTY